MTHPNPSYRGVWLPLVTPFKNGALDEASLRRLVRAYAGRVEGLVLCATTGEGLALSPDETQRVVAWTAEEVEAARARTGILLGLCGPSTSAVVRAVEAARSWPVDGLLVTCPYYVRPSQTGLRLHFEAIADAAEVDVLAYNIPYRTGVNLENDTLLRLAERPNMAGVKDCCADRAQSLDLIRRKPPGFSVLAGEDAGFAQALKDGAQGGVTASAHLDPDGFRRVCELADAGRWSELDAAWAGLSSIPELLFAEPSPAPLKHCLWRKGLIDSPALRLPMTPISAELAARLDRAGVVGA